jgi:hypothetical protein
MNLKTVSNIPTLHLFNIVSFLSLDLSANYQSNFYQHDAMNTGFEYALGIGFAVGN